VKPKQITAALAALALLFAGRPAAAAADAGQVMTFNGECFVTAGDQRTPLKRGDTVHVGDVVEVPEDAKLKLLMSDGSVLALGSGSKMTIKNYDVDAAGDKRDAQLSLDSGLLRAVVTPASETSKFEIETATGVAAARSTDWFVEAAPDQMRVTVLEGTVAVARRDDKSQRPGKAAKDLLLTANYSSQIISGREPPKAVAWAPEGFQQLIDRTSVRFGWCQCITDHTVVRAECTGTQDKCAATCSGATYSFVPDARQACAAFYVEAISSRTKRH
jgi:hypothetical protein